MPSLIRADDIVAIMEPSHPSEWIARQFTNLLDAALRSPAAILFVPKRLARTRGPVMVTASEADDPSLATTLEIAGALKEPLIVALAGAPLSTEFLASAKRLNVSVRRINGHEAARRAAPLIATPVGNERLRVAARARLADDAVRVFAQLRDVPLLAVGPGPAGCAADQDDQVHSAGEHG